MQKEVPHFLYEELIKQYGEELTKKIVKGYASKRFITLRVNTLKTNKENIKKTLYENKIDFQEVKWNQNALIILNSSEQEIRKLEAYENGEIYLQSLSSMIPAIILSPKANENILDMTAAPGSKTTQMSAISNNEALITACEKNKIRAERLKYNIEKQGASRVNVLVQDARNLDNYFSFDKILLDAPCSGSGTIYLEDKKLENTFTQELIERSAKTQFELLKKALTILKPGQEMVYSTCSILKQENENQIQKFLKQNIIEIIPIDNELTKELPLLQTNLEGTITVCPTELYEGFFVAKLKKLAIKNK